MAYWILGVEMLHFAQEWMIFVLGKCSRVHGIRPRLEHSYMYTQTKQAKKQMLWSLHAVKPTRTTASGPQSSCTDEDNSLKRGALVFKPRSNTRTT